MDFLNDHVSIKLPSTLECFKLNKYAWTLKFTLDTK